MNDDLKNQIEIVEKEALSQSELEQKLKKKKEDINRLNFTLKEQKLLIEDLRSQIKEEEGGQIELPSEIQILKDMIRAQRKELSRQDNIINHLNEKIDEQIALLKNDGSINFQEKNEKELIEAQKLIIELTNKNEEYKSQMIVLQNQVDEIQSQDRKIENIDYESIETEEDEKLVYFKRLNFQLIEESGLLRVEVEKLKAKLHQVKEEELKVLKVKIQKVKEEASEKVKVAKINVKVLTEEIEDYEAQVDLLKKEIEKNVNESNSEELKLANNKIKILTTELEEYKTQAELLKKEKQKEVKESNPEELELANTKIKILTTELEDFKAQAELLKKEKQKEVKESNPEETELANNKIKILTSELEDYEAQVELLKKEIHERVKESNSDELNLANNKIKILTAEIEDYEAQVKYLQENSEKDNQKLSINNENNSEFLRMQQELLEYQKQSLVLNDIVGGLNDGDELIQENGEENDTSKFYTIPTKIPISLFNRIYKILDDPKKKNVRKILIQDLKSEYHEVKINAIKILSQIKDNKVYEIFLEMIHDPDWLVRLYIVKALSKFKNKNEELIDLMKELSRDVDVDVRELAIRILYSINNH